MAHFAELDENNVVLRVIVISNADIRDEAGNEDELIGAALCARLVGHGTWIQTSYNGNFRGRLAHPGWSYNPDYDIFMQDPQPYPSWVPDSQFLCWEAPIPKPEDGPYYWDEASRSWVKE